MEIEIDKAYNCDCKELLLEMQKTGIKADWCITDPPYGLSIASKGRMGGGWMCQSERLFGTC